MTSPMTWPSREATSQRDPEIAKSQPLAFGFAMEMPSSCHIISSHPLGPTGRYRVPIDTRSRLLNISKYKSPPSTMGNAVSSKVSWSIILDHEVAGQSE